MCSLVVKPVQESGRDGPVFFLSYAHTPQRDPADSADPDVWVAKLFSDLCEHIAQLTDVRPSEAGFMERSLKSGIEWPSQLKQALATCRVFVPLYSRRYFASEHCGREWFAFTRRELNKVTREGQVEAVIPALWVPVRQEALPEAARAIQFDHREFGDDRYAEHGFFGIMKVSRFREDYELAVYELARRIIEVAERAPVEPGLEVDPGELPSAFGPPLPTESDRLQVLVTCYRNCARSDRAYPSGAVDSGCAVNGPCRLSACRGRLRRLALG